MRNGTLRWKLQSIVGLGKPDGMISIVAHRATGESNSLEALRRAAASDTSGVELDVMVTADAVPVVSHDMDLATAGSPRINLLTAADCVSHVPSLAEALEALGECRLIYLHYKRENEGTGSSSVDVGSHAAAIARCVEDASLAGTVVVMVESGNTGPFRMNAPKLEVLRCWLGAKKQPGRFSYLDDQQGGSGYVGIYHSPRQLSVLGRVLHRVGLRRTGVLLGFGPTRRLLERVRSDCHHIVVFTINDPWLMNLYWCAGVDAVGTDTPERLLREIESRTVRGDRDR